MKVSAVIGLIAMLGVGCTTAYQKAGLTGGFVETDLGKNAWRVTFSGNGYTSYETVQTFWLYRCCEIALDKGFDGFEILSDIRLSMLISYDRLCMSSEGDQKPTAIHAIYSPMSDSASLSLCHGGGGVVIVPMPMVEAPINKPSIVADILLLKAPISEKVPKVFDARKLKAALDPYVDGPIKKGGNVKPHLHEYLFPDKHFGEESSGKT